jgi:hypothetical protein
MSYESIRFFRVELKNADGHVGFSFHATEQAAFAKAKKFESAYYGRSPFTKVEPIVVNTTMIAIVAMMNRYASHPKVGDA